MPDDGVEALALAGEEIEIGRPSVPQMNRPESEIRDAIAAVETTVDDAQRLGIAADLATTVFRPRSPPLSWVDREPPDPAALTTVERAVLDVLARHLDRPGGPSLVWLGPLSAAMRSHGLPESTAGLRGYLGLGPRAAMEIFNCAWPACRRPAQPLAQKLGLRLGPRRSRPHT